MHFNFFTLPTHFISAYEKGHQRPPLTVYTFQAPDQSLSQPASPVTSITPTENLPKTAPPPSPIPSIKSLVNKPPLPTVSIVDLLSVRLKNSLSMQLYGFM